MPGSTATCTGRSAAVPASSCSTTRRCRTSTTTCAAGTSRRCSATRRASTTRRSTPPRPCATSTAASRSTGSGCPSRDASSRRARSPSCTAPGPATPSPPAIRGRPSCTGTKRPRSATPRPEGRPARPQSRSARSAASPGRSEPHRCSGPSPPCDGRPPGPGSSSAGGRRPAVCSSRRCAPRSLREGLAGSVELHIEVPQAEMARLMGACDAVVALRWPTVGETSGPMMRAFGIGRLVIASDVPQNRELDPRFCWRVPVGEGEDTVLAQRMRQVVADPGSARAAGDLAPRVRPSRGVLRGRGLPVPRARRGARREEGAVAARPPSGSAGARRGALGAAASAYSTRWRAGRTFSR